MKLPRVWAEVSLDAIAANLEKSRELLWRATPGCEVLAVVKADAYGHGAGPVAATLEAAGIAMLGVSDSHEAIQLREWGIRAPILVLGAVVESEIPELLHHGITPTIHSPDRIETFARFARHAGMRMPVHLLVDTGLSLLGVRPERALDRLLEIERAPSLELRGLGTHLAAPDGDAELTRLQLSRFRQVIEAARSRGLRLPRLHVESSLALERYPEAHFDMVRLGGFLYGLRQHRQPDLEPLTPALALYSQIVHLRDLGPGTPVSYDGTFVTSRATRVATLAVGYHDGFSHRLSNRGQVLIRGRRAPVIGRVTMDYVLVDATEVAGARVGDRAVLIGRDGSEEITAEDLARWADTCAYEIPSLLGPRVRRFYLRRGTRNATPGDARDEGTEAPPVRRYMEQVELTP